MPRQEKAAVSTRCARILFAGCAAVLAAALGATTALAATTWTIRPGGAITAKSGTATVKDTKNRQFFTCKSLSASGTLKSGSGLSGAQAGSISTVGFHTCTSPLGRFRAPRVDLIWTPRATGLPWHVNFSSLNGGVVTGTISHLQIKVSADGACSFVIDGTSATARDGMLRFTYADSTGRLALLTTGGTLHSYNVVGCAGLFNPGDPVTIGATFALSPKQTITSP
jgi:hypothetical protein